MRSLQLRLVSLGVLLGVFLLLGATGSASANPHLTGQQKISAVEGGLQNPLCYGPRFGQSVALIGDIDNDGVPDLAVGGPHPLTGGGDYGEVFILRLNMDGTVKADTTISDGLGGIPSGALQVKDYFGWGVAGLGDLDGDGVGDLAVTAWGDDDVGTNNGAVWILFLNSDGTVRTDAPYDPKKIPHSEINQGGDWFGYSIASMGDLNGDGTTDLVVGAPGDDDGGSSPAYGDEGAVFLLFLNSEGNVIARKKISETQGGNTPNFDEASGSPGSGKAVACIGDLDGNGVNDIAVQGGPIWSSNSHGEVYIFFLSETYNVSSYYEIRESDVTGITNGPYTNFGSSLAGMGDLTCGTAAGNILAVGAIWNPEAGLNAGAVHLLYLNPDGTVDAVQKITEGQGGFTGVLDESDYFGSAVAPIGDVDGNGSVDFAVGAMNDADGSCSAYNGGAMWILFTDCMGTVPVLLQSVDSRWKDRYVEVVWRLTGIDGQLGFEIWRKEPSRDSSVRMNDVQVTRNGDEFTFTDPGASPGGTYVYHVVVRQDGDAVTSFETTVVIPAAEFALEQNVPNPFNPKTRIDFSVSEPSTVTLTIYDVTGRVVTELMNETVNAGVHYKEWDGRDSRGENVASGIYFYRLTAGKRTLVRKAVLLK